MNIGYAAFNLAVGLIVTCILFSTVILVPTEGNLWLGLLIGIGIVVFSIIVLKSAIQEKRR